MTSSTRTDTRFILFMEIFIFFIQNNTISLQLSCPFSKWGFLAGKSCSILPQGEYSFGVGLVMCHFASVHTWLRKKKNQIFYLIKNSSDRVHELFQILEIINRDAFGSVIANLNAPASRHVICSHLYSAREHLSRFIWLQLSLVIPFKTQLQNFQSVLC